MELDGKICFKLVMKIGGLKGVLQKMWERDTGVGEILQLLWSCCQACGTNTEKEHRNRG